MKLLRDSLLLRALRRLLAGRRHTVRRPYTVTVPAPLERAAAGNNVIELHRRTPSAVSRVSAPAQADVLPSSVHLALVSSR
ncbi:hypothetical protein GCM10008098_27970 [Rhodanobacter panaciterrae]|uniref:Uncharacterized protein n=1 Tax=Rhodanobacter panaciterrae TaxID=490572 RepID=A0ABQ3A389_9GAMM|nr:hypothetical protein [Rhodanobacter panaciterrae]GGY32880.1 hypothetical protein GCM10008098_27970 [Rhodanobacter panaciterrae]